MGDVEPVETTPTPEEVPTKETTIVEETNTVVDGAGKGTNDATNEGGSSPAPSVENKEEENAVIKIQSLQRQKKARQTFAEKRIIHNKKLAKKKEEKILEDVSKVIETKADELAIVKVQSIIRQKQAKKSFAQKRKEIAEAKQAKLVELASAHGRVYPEGEVPKPAPKKKLVTQLCTII